MLTMLIENRLIMNCLKKSILIDKENEYDEVRSFIKNV